MIEGYQERRFSYDGRSRPVLVSDEAGPPVILLHEVYGINAPLLEFAGAIRTAGFRLYLPVLFGSSDPPSGAAGKAMRILQFLCVAYQFHALLGEEPGPWAEWLRQLVPWACADSGHPRAGVIGLCLTGSYALSAAVSPAVAAAVAGEPSLNRRNDGLHLSREEVEALRARTEAGLAIRGYRYETDPRCPGGRFRKLEAAFPHGFEGTTIPVPTGETLHSVFTEHLKEEDGRLRHEKVAEVIGFLEERLGA